MIAPAAILFVLSQAPQLDLAGDYRTSQMEVAGALELQPGGSFRFALEYGAVSEYAEGSWAFSGNTVRLTSKPLPPQPQPELSWTRFEAQPLLVDGGSLLLQRHDTVIRFRRVSSGGRQED